MKTKTAEQSATPEKLQAEQQQILSIVNRHRYTSKHLEELFWYIGFAEIGSFVSDMDAHIASHLGSVDSMEDEEIRALWKLFTFTRTLADIKNSR